MAAGSLIAAMAGEQSLDRMGGFRRAMPFTFACFVIGGLALAGIPPFSGFFSEGRDPAARRRPRRLALGALRRRLPRRAAHRRLHVPDDLPRLLRRAGARRRASSSRATSHHAEVPTNPATGEEEDTDVGFPGPEHHIAERALPMKVAMGAAGAVGASSAGCSRSPRSTTSSTSSSSRRSRTRACSSAPRPTACSPSAWCWARSSAWPASRSPTACGCSSPAPPPRSASASPRLHRLFVNKWYFDELIDVVVVRPARLGRALRPADLRARGRQRRARRRHDGRRARRLGRGARRAERATCATTPRCCCSALAGRRPLLPDREQLTCRSRS